MSDAEGLREALRGAIANRAMVYLHVFKAIARRHGEDEAADVLKEAIYARGCEIGRRFSHLEPTDMAGIRDAFLAFLPDHDLLDPEVRRDDAGGIDIKFHRCPLKEAWVGAGLSEREIARLCEIAGVIDNGTFEAAGFAFSAETWTPGEEGCCCLHIRPGGGEVAG